MDGEHRGGSGDGPGVASKGASIGDDKERQVRACVRAVSCCVQVVALQVASRLTETNPRVTVCVRLRVWSCWKPQLDLRARADVADILSFASQAADAMRVINREWKTYTLQQVEQAIASSRHHLTDAQ